MFEQVGKNDGSLIDLAMTSVSFEEQKRQHSLRPEDNGRAERARIGGVGRPGTRYADTLQTRVSNPNRHLGRTPVDESLVDLTTSPNDEVTLYQSFKTQPPSGMNSRDPTSSDSPLTSTVHHPTYQPGFID